MNDFKFGLRQLLKRPGWTTIAVLTLALGIGSNTAVFSFVNAVLLRPLPYHEPHRLVMVFENHITNGFSKVLIGAPLLEQWRRQVKTFAALGAVRSFGNFALTGRGQPEMLRGSAFSANLFPLLGIQPLIGRGFLSEEEVYGHHHVTLLSYEFWQRRFGGDTSLIGQSLTLGMEPYTVIGVMPPRTFSPDGERDLWIPLAFTPAELSDRHSHNFSVYGRLKPGVSVRGAQREMELIAQRLAGADAQNRGWGAEVYPLHEIVVGNTRRLLLVLLAAVGMVLMIACANITSLLLARLTERSREFAVRLALGARRSELVQQLLTETLLLGAIGGLLGLVIARALLTLLIRFVPPEVPRIAEGIPLDGAGVAFAGLITIGTGILVGLLPALQASSSNLTAALAETNRGGSAGRRRQLARAGLVVSEVALSLVLLVGAGLMIRSFDRLLRQDLGFKPEHLVTVGINLPPQKYMNQTDRVVLLQPLLAAVRAIPGVDSAAYAFGVPLTGVNRAMDVAVQNAPPPAPGESVSAGYAQISPGYFATMKTPLLAGRDFTDRDATNTVPSVIVDEAFARNFHLGEGDHVLGRRIDLGAGDGSPGVEIVGLVRSVKRVGMAEGMRGEMYRPYQQICWGFVTLVVRTQRPPGEVTRAIRAELDRLDKDLPLASVRTMSQLVAANVGQRQLFLHLLSGFAGAAVVLSALGLYGNRPTWLCSEPGDWNSGSPSAPSRGRFWLWSLVKA
ncbi:MAG: ABC transporter permease [Verrucomicrobiota bacterium]